MPLIARLSATETARPNSGKMATWVTNASAKPTTTFAIDSVNDITRDCPKVAIPPLSGRRRDLAVANPAQQIARRQRRAKHCQNGSGSRYHRNARGSDLEDAALLSDLSVSGSRRTASRPIVGHNFRAIHFAMLGAALPTRD